MPVIEEISDDEIDNMHLSLEEFDPHNPFSKSMPVEGGPRLRPTGASTTVPSAASSTSEIVNIPQTPVVTSQSNSGPQLRQQAQIPEHMKTWTQIYPIYFDNKRSRKDGRKVDMVYAVKNPLAVTISDACVSFGISAGLELNKTHPQDWSNPGRVRVKVPEGVSKTELLLKISKYLKQNPPTEKTARKEVYSQVAMFDSLQPIASLKNETLAPILPGISRALSASRSIDEQIKAGGSPLG